MALPAFGTIIHAGNGYAVQAVAMGTGDLEVIFHYSGHMKVTAFIDDKSSALHGHEKAADVTGLSHVHPCRQIDKVTSNGFQRAALDIDFPGGTEA